MLFRERKETAEMTVIKDYSRGFINQKVRLYYGVHDAVKNQRGVNLFVILHSYEEGVCKKSRGFSFYTPAPCVDLWLLLSQMSQTTILWQKCQCQKLLSTTFQKENECSNCFANLQENFFLFFSPFVGEGSIDRKIKCNP